MYTGALQQSGDVFGLRCAYQVNPCGVLFNPASAKNDDAIGEEKRFVQIVRDEQHCDLHVRTQVHEKLLQNGPRDGVQRTKRLVHQKDGGLVSNRARNCHTLALPAGQLTRMSRAESLCIQPDQPKRVRSPGPGIGTAVQPRNKRHVAQSGPVRKQAGFLLDVPNLAAQRHRVTPCSVDSSNRDLS
jgi:hypothetical protein